MSSVTTRNTSGVNVILVRGAATNSGSSHSTARSPWIDLTTSPSTGWVVDTSGATEGTYSAADRRSYLTGPATAGTGTTNLTVAYRDWETDRKSTRLNSSHLKLSRMPSSA